MTLARQRVPLGNLVTLRDTDVVVDRAQEYEFAGVYSFGRGAFRGRRCTGSSFAYDRLTRLRAGNFVYPKLMAWEGGFAVVPPELDGLVVSPEFPVFEVDSRRLLPGYLSAYFRASRTWEAAARLCTGTNVRRRRLQPSQFLRYEIPLPPLAEQRRIVERVTKVAARVEEAQQLATETAAGRLALGRALLFASIVKRESVPMRDLVSMREPDTIVDRERIYQFAGVFSFGRGVFRASRRKGSDFAYDRLTQVRSGNFVYPKLMAWEGGLGVVPPTCDGCFVSPEFPVFEVDERRVLPEVLDVYFRSPTTWPALAEISSGTNVRRRRLQPSAFLNFAFPLPPMERQRKVREVLLRLREEEQHVQDRTALLDRILPATIDSLFRNDHSTSLTQPTRGTLATAAPAVG